MQTSIMNINDNYAVIIKNIGNELKQLSFCNTLASCLIKGTLPIACLSSLFLISEREEGGRERK